MNTNLEREIKNAIIEKTIIIGTNKTLKALEKKEIKQVVIANTCPKDIIDKVNNDSKKLKITSVNISAKNLGVICRKPFSVCVLGLK
ncbi:MAG: ribosomal L7Ae/L30e/S12e/Gadd45 family protein [Candidatus Aenigmarchaeota archaeon]|nr:ribosomal L7Ae/L30e/S12e/Gadd45 family protein [Candidatus Aenigmarchaeota archaeon]